MVFHSLEHARHTLPLFDIFATLITIDILQHYWYFVIQIYQHWPTRAVITFKYRLCQQPIICQLVLVNTHVI